MSWFKKLFIHSPFHYLIALVVATILFLVALFARKVYSILFIADAFAIGGGVTFLYGGLVLVNYLGAFDTIGYGFSTFLGKKRKYEDLVDYSEKKKESRKLGNFIFMPYFTVGALFLLVSAILFFI